MGYETGNLVPDLVLCIDIFLLGLLCFTVITVAVATYVEVLLAAGPGLYFVCQFHDILRAFWSVLERTNRARGYSTDLIELHFISPFTDYGEDAASLPGLSRRVKPRGPVNVAVEMSFY